MLSSQMASLSQSSIPTCLLQSSISSSTVILRSSGTLRKRTRQDQVRALRIGLWTSYLDPSFEKEFRRRHRTIKHKYIEALNRKLSWNRQYPGFTKPSSLKGFMCSAWRGQDSRPGGRWVNMDRLDTEKSDSLKSTNSGIEDVELGAVDKLWGKDGFYETLRSSSQAFRNGFETLENSIYQSYPQSGNRTIRSLEPTYKGRRNARENQSVRQDQVNADVHPEYEIDPITNRKVFRNRSAEDSRRSIQVPVKTFKDHRSQFVDVQPAAAQASKPEQVPPPNRESKPKSLDTTRECLQEYEGTETYKPYFAYEPNGEKPDSTQNWLGTSDQRASYRWSSWFSSPETSLSDQPRKPCPVKEGLKDYDSRTCYQTSSSVEPEIKVSEKTNYRDAVQKGLKEFDDTACYGPVKATKSNTAITEKHSVEESLKDFDARTSYGPVLHNEPDGKLPAKQETTSDGLHEFDSKANYNPRRILKNISLTPGGLGTDKSFRWQDEKDTREDLDLLRPSDVRAASGIVKGLKKETEAEKLAKRIDLVEDFLKPQASEQSYSNEMAAAVKNQESWNLPGTSNGTKKMARKLTGNYVRDFPEEFETKWTASNAGSGALQPNDQTDAWGYDKAPKGLELSYQHEVENDVQKAEKEYIDGRASKEAFTRTPETQRLQTSLERGSPRDTAKIATTSKERAETDLDVQKLTGHGLESSYADECKQQSELDPYSKKPQGLETSYAEECAAQQGEGDLSASVSSFGSSKQDEATSKLQSTSTANSEMNDWNVHAEAGFPSGSIDKDTAMLAKLRALYEEKYGRIDLTHRQVSSSTFPATKAISSDSVKTISEDQDPTVYKILAYDPTMQSINTAETTSIVSDTEPALTPAEVLLRLSNPAKFFPHFEPLQNEGYEIVSGSGDVLVFRKVRAAAPPVVKNGPPTPYQNRTRRNPIDGMQGRPIAATGNFASPTGFVNYDRPMPSESAFKSNIDVRREEPVFSGKSSWAKDEESSSRKRPGLGKRILIGSAMVGGCSYAIGVVAEYFKSGGIDGLGPQSF